MGCRFARILICTCLLAGCRDPQRESAGFDDLIRGDLAIDRPDQLVEDSWARVLDPRPFDFPRDHAAHPEYRIEWWYYTGNVESDTGRRFGYQLTFFRTGFVREPQNPSRWAVRDLYTAHFALSDLDRQRHRAFQRNNRRGIGFAGAETEHYEVWNGSWRVLLDGETHRLVAADSGGAIDLRLQSSKPPVLHGDRGLSRKGPSVGNASYYYSLTRMATIGEILFDGERFSVDGDSWMDHEFSSSFLEPGQRGWDWFALQLSNGEEIMLYQMRRDDGAEDPFSSGTLVDREGGVERLAREDFVIQPVERWTSPDSQARYPVGWRVQLPERGYDLQVAAAFKAQEMRMEASTGIVYWEGSVTITGRAGAEPVVGRGYVELTGYSGMGLGSMFEN
jgi:predicted secreted hydrolase